MAGREPNPDESPETAESVPLSEALQSVSGSYADSLKLSVLIQLTLFVLAAMLLDGGGTLHGFGIAAAGYWIGAVLIILRRPKNPTQVDLDLVKYGFIWTSVCVIIIAMAIAVTRATLGN